MSEVGNILPANAVKGLADRFKMVNAGKSRMMLLPKLVSWLLSKRLQ